ncbi:MAG: sugar ABC transporter ATP-binding protein, partial [Methylobacterium mesophilicum]|nr:sugar ABC transporter ATP-binding protein [Methylobacterium mesophilicum]
KSTLMKILTGVYSKDGGTVAIEGQTMEFATPRDAERAGIAMIFQEFSLVPTLSVAQNMFLKREPRAAGGALVNDAEAARRAREIMKELGEDIDVRMPVEQLSVGMCQMVEIGKALSKNARILVMDEPTSSLSENETSRLFQIIAKLKASGISIVYISHRMAEIFAVCDRITAMRDGENVLTDDAKNLSMDRLVDAMLGSAAGSSLEWHARSHDLGGKPALQVEDLSLEGHYDNVSFAVYPGEIVGLAGLMGSGRTEIVESIFGVRRPQRGRILMNGVDIRSNRAAIDAGIGLVPENRRTQGLLLDHSLRDNVMLPNLARFTKGFFVSDAEGTKASQGFIRSLKIKTDGPGKIARLLSGGNQQKIVLAKWLARQPKLLILDEPTIGVDIGAKSDIVDIVRRLAAQGTAILVISSEFEELLAMSDRLLVIHDGRLIKELDRRAIDSEEVLHHAVQG